MEESLIWRYEEFFGVILLSIFLGALVFRKTRDFSSGMLVSWVLISATMIFLNPEQISYGALEMRLKLISARSFVTTSMLVTFVYMLTETWDEVILFFLEITAVLNAVLLLAVGQGIFSASSMDAAFVAMVYPVILFREKQRPYIEQFLMALIPAMAFIFADSGSTWDFCLACSFTAYFVLNRKYALTGAFLLTLAGAGLWLNGPALYQSHDRIVKWEMFSKWWLGHVSVLFGAGTGTFAVLGPEIQSAISPEFETVNGQLYQSNLFTWAHNDWLQIMFEQGIIGLSLAVTILIVCLVRARNRPWIFSTICGCAFAMITQFPMRYFVSQLFMLLLVKMALTGDGYEAN